MDGLINSRITTQNKRSEDRPIEKSLRPLRMEEYIGQDKIKTQLRIFIDAAKARNESLDHVLFYGPPGLGKTTLASIIAHEMDVQLKITSGPAIERPGDLAAILTTLEEGDVLFIDEIHRLNRVVEEVLYPAMEDHAIDIIVGKGPSSRSIRLDLNNFTLVGATTRAGLLSSPLRDRFGMICKLDFYSPEELAIIVTRSAVILDVEIDVKGAVQIARRSRGTPRIANRLLKRVRDYAQVVHQGAISDGIAAKALELMEVDAMGLDHVDIRLLHTILEDFAGGPVGLDTLAASIGEDSSTIEDVVEPYLLQIGLLQRTPRGRVVTAKGRKYFGEVLDSDLISMLK